MRVSLLLISALLAGCAGASTTPAGAPMGTGPATQAIGFNDDSLVQNSTFGIGVRLTGESGVTNKKYGALLGYFKGSTSKKTQVITILMGSSVVFSNVDTARPHTGSLLGDATKKGASWPSTFTGSGTQSAAGTDISTAKFSTGTLNPGSSSLTYSANVPGFYMFGCMFHYVSNGMRDIIIVKT